MFFGVGRHTSGSNGTRGFFTAVRLPLRLTEADADRAFVRPLARKLTELQFGRITGHRVSTDDENEPIVHEITMSLVTQAPRAFRTIADFLDGLDAPQGSWIGNAECPEMLPFGRATGLGLYLDLTENGDTDDVLDVLEACTEALEGAGLYQGSKVARGCHALYFYGDNFNRMHKAMAFVLTTDPRCRNAVARRLD